MKSSLCPVPINQIPIKEYESLTKSIFFKWPTISKNYLYRRLIYSWIIFLPLTIIILSGNYELINSPAKLIFSSLIWSLIIPLVLLFRHLLSWKYIYKRLKSEVIEYEESGWYDGQTWEKDIEMREKDLLTAQHDAKPIIDLLNQTIYKTLIIFCIGITTLNIIPINRIF